MINTYKWKILQNKVAKKLFNFEHSNRKVVQLDIEHIILLYHMKIIFAENFCSFTSRCVLCRSKLNSLAATAGDC